MNTFANLIYLIVICIFAYVFIMILKLFYNSVAEKRYNDNQPILTKDTKISAKRTEISGGGKHSVSTFYYSTFEFVEDKARIELEIDEDDYGLLAEGDLGRLTFQGRRYLKFERT